MKINEIATNSDISKKRSWTGEFPFEDPKWLARNGKRLGKLSGMDVWIIDSEGIADEVEMLEAEKTVVVTNPKKSSSRKMDLVGYTELTNVSQVTSLSKLKNSYSVDMMRISNQYQGFKFGPQLYRFMVKNLKFVLASGTEQSAGGRYLWNELAKTPNIAVYAIDSKGKMHETEPGDGEVTSYDLQIYERDTDHDYNGYDSDETADEFPVKGVAKILLAFPIS